MASEPSIQVKVSLTEKDLEDFYAHLAKRSILMKLLVAFSLVVFVAQLIRIVAEPQALETGIMWIGFIIFLFLMMIYSNKYNARKAYRNNKRLLEEYTYSINDKVIHVEGKSVNVSLQWEKLQALSESKNSLFIWLDKKNAQIIPKRYLSDDEMEVIRIIKDMKMKKK
jgi:hypothetical protein